MRSVEVDFNLSLRERGGYPTPGGFLQRVRKHMKTCKKVQKSAQECEKKGDRSKRVARLEGLMVEKSGERIDTRQFSQKQNLKELRASHFVSADCQGVAVTGFSSRYDGEREQGSKEVRW